jgi:glycosyltransferase 2 family protein
VDLPARMTTTDAPPPATEPERQMVRSPTSLLRLVVGAVVLAAGIMIAWKFANTAAALNVDWEALVDPLPEWVQALPTIVVVLALLVTPVAVNIVLVVQRRFRLMLVINVAAVAAFALSEVLVKVLTRTPPSQFPDAYIVNGNATSPNDPLLAAFIAALVVGLPVLSPSLRRLAYWVVALDLFVTLGFSEVPAVAFVLDVGVGITCGAAVALAFGTPDSRPSPAQIAGALQRSGVDVVAVEPAAVDARGSTPWFGTTGDGSRLFIKVLNQDNRSAELLFRAFRALFLRNTGDERIASSRRRSVEHEALLSLRASGVGIRTPELQAVSEVGTDGMLLAYTAIPGSSLDGVPDEALTDELLDTVWGQVLEMRAAGIAHRDLRLANIFLADDGVPQVIDFGFAELAASPLLLATDLAELMGTTAPKVGVRRAVDAGERAVGVDGLREALPRVQPYALGSATRTALKEDGLLEPLRDEVRGRVGEPEVTYEPLV